VGRTSRIWNFGNSSFRRIAEFPKVLYYFDQFGQKLAFLHFRKISENLKNREKIKSGIKKNGVMRDGRIDRNSTVYCTDVDS
jgi:hypothetical protein